ncbi:MAG: zinc ribbon domain-containing protein [Methanocellales archaeon]|nr:zinc ribbon domain-containing protein [Methanocellales archaeon]
MPNAHKRLKRFSKIVEKIGKVPDEQILEELKRLHDCTYEKTILDRFEKWLVGKMLPRWHHDRKIVFNYCPYCRLELEIKHPCSWCDACGSPLERGFNICPNCGTKTYYGGR